MSLTLELGTGVVGADSYVSVSDAATYITNRHGASHAFVMATTTVQEQYLRQAADFLENRYRGRWRGSRYSNTQGLAWPRVNAIDEEGYILDDLPAIIETAQTEVARLLAEDTTLFSNVDGGKSVKSEKVGTLAIVYDESAIVRHGYFEIIEGILRGAVTEMPSVAKVERG